MTPGQKLQQAYADTQVTGWVDPLRWEDFDEAGHQRFEAAARRFLELIREPTEYQWDYLSMQNILWVDNTSTGVWKAFVDALIKESLGAAD